MKIEGYGPHREAHAEWANNVWVMSPEPFAMFATIVSVPDALIVLGTLVVEPDLYSDDEEERFYAAHWLVDQYLRLLDGTDVDIEWDITGGPEPEPDEFVDGQEVVY